MSLVSKAVLVITTSTALTGVSVRAESSVTFLEPDPSCKALVEPQQYIVQWASGKITVVRAPGKAALMHSLPTSASDRIEFIEPDFRIHLNEVTASKPVVSAPADWGQRRVNAPAAWKLAQGEGVLVAVIDAGVDINHRQLKGRIAVNSREIPQNGIDDDFNGYIDDYAGYDFSARSGDVHDSPSSTHHGSMLSGLIAAEHLEGEATVKGLAPKAKILPLTFMDDNGSGSVSDAIEAINYAVARGAKIINASWGTEACSLSLQRALAGLENQGVLFVAAAGNGDNYGIGVDVEKTPVIPASYGFSGQITVAAMSDDNLLAGFSNFSQRLVHLAAPGVGIKSTVFDDGASPDHGYAWMNGTSVAAPFVSGAAAVLWSYRPKATVTQVKAAILASINRESHVTLTRGYLNLHAALEQIAKQVTP